MPWVLFLTCFLTSARGGIEFPPDSPPRIPKELFSDSSRFVSPFIVQSDDEATSGLRKLKQLVLGKQKVIIGLGVNRVTIISSDGKTSGKFRNFYQQFNTKFISPKFFDAHISTFLKP